MASVEPCRRCKKASAPFSLRNDPTCRDCFVDFVESKGGRRLGAVARDTRKTQGRPGPRRYLAGLSFGPSSTALMQILDTSARYHSSKKSCPAFEPLVVHVDTDLSPSSADQPDATPAQRLLQKYRDRFPNLSFACVHLSKIWTVKTIDWPAVLGQTFVEEDDALDDVARLRRLFDDLPSMTSRADLLRLFIRHLLLGEVLEKSYTALLFGHSTTALAALTLAEVANGRGFAVPWQTNDGPFSVTTYDAGPDSGSDAPRARKVSENQLPIYYPLREIFKNEIMTYLDLVPSIKHLIPEDSSYKNIVISHKDMSIADVMQRYFDSVEGPYSGIVANVVRTTGKLDRLAGGGSCRLCAVTLDAQGDLRWAGELGDETDESGLVRMSELCYGCRRTVHT